ncbi:gluconolaconase [Nocardia panacis]|uniref:Gluconolaconase n=1 Tax=Nocardia panacis TaxID=2340916 RepID=A0A3A4KKB5_9NOCA|nr:gluconolaconase [Nocardia panacis]RJO75131.1 gluconolaconase [Nocardia panacis]
MPSQHEVGPTYKPSRFVRHPLTKRNQEELEIAGKAGDILAWNKRTWRGGNKVLTFVNAPAQKKNADGTDRLITPTGFSINKRRYGDYPISEQSAHDRGWYAYLNMGVPLIDERHDIVQPPPDVISEHAYIDRTDPVLKEIVDTIEFSISNTVRWSIAGQTQLTFGAKGTASLQAQLQQSLANSMASSLATSQELSNEAKSSRTHIDHNHKDNIGTEDQQLNEQTTTNKTTATSTSTGTTTATTTATGTATGTGELSAQLMQGITATASGELTASWKATHQVVVTPNGCRVVVRATQRRQVRRFDYQIPIVFNGFVALYYPEPVDYTRIPDIGGYGVFPAWTLGPRIQTQNRNPGAVYTGPSYAQVVVFPIDVLGLVADGDNFAQKGVAEVVSVLAGEHEVFEVEALTLANRKSAGPAPFYTL